MVDSVWMERGGGSGEGGWCMEGGGIAKGMGGGEGGGIANQGGGRHNLSVALLNDAGSDILV